jgi:hypothetical protein
MQRHTCYKLAGVNGNNKLEKWGQCSHERLLKKSTTPNTSSQVLLAQGGSTTLKQWGPVHWPKVLMIYFLEKMNSCIPSSGHCSSNVYIESCYWISYLLKLHEITWKALCASTHWEQRQSPIPYSWFSREISWSGGNFTVYSGCLNFFTVSMVAGLIWGIKAVRVSMTKENKHSNGTWAVGLGL